MSEDWLVRAACRKADPELAFAHEGSTETATFIADYCACCPVTRECLSFARRTGQNYGVFGGLTGADRARLRRFGTRPCEVCGARFIPMNGTNVRCPEHRRPSVVANPGQVKEHGTAAGFAQHRRRDEEPCQACRDARNAKDQRRKKRGLVRGAA